MTPDTTLPARRHRGLSSAVAESLRQLPTRRPVGPSTPSSSLQWEVVDLERYAVRAGAETLGFIDVVGAVFVVLLGARYDRAVEVMQTLVFDEALAALAAEAKDPRD